MSKKRKKFWLVCPPCPAAEMSFAQSCVALWTSDNRMWRVQCTKPAESMTLVLIALFICSWRTTLKKHRCAKRRDQSTWGGEYIADITITPRLVLLLVLLPRGGYYIIEDMLLKKHRCAEHMGRGVYCWRYYFPEADISPICYCRPCYTRGYLKTMSSVDGRTNVQI